MAPPSDAFAARLNDTVTAGNCPWRTMASGSVVLSTCANALRGTALLRVEAVAAMGVVTVADSAVATGASVFALGVYGAVAVRTLVPAAVDADGPPNGVAAVAL